MLKDILKNFSIDFAGFIWKVRLDTQSDLLALEIRDADQYQTSFATFNINTGQILCKDVFLEESWWLDLVTIHQSILLVHNYEDQQQPRPSGIWAIDGKNGEILWHLVGREFVAIQGQQVITQRLEAEITQYELFELRSGLFDKELSHPNLDYSSDILPSSLVYPIRYHEGEKNFQIVKEFIKKRIKVEILGAVDYLEYENLLFISYFFGKNSQLNNKLLTLDLKDNVILHELLDLNLRGIALDTFFIYNTQLIFIKEKKQLNGYLFHY